ncbi:MAG: GTPase ObgE, partial [Candidatus Margulisiibacteriota bacterium]
GGDGGNGGSIIVKASRKISTFLDISHKKVIKAGHGEDGKPRKQSGKKGADTILKVPCGTIVYNLETNDIICDLVNDNQSFCIAKGGHGGKGNIHFSTARVQTPRKATPGTMGEHQRIRLELKVIADVGLIGYPNAGKSTLLKTITQANPKIANYPFTTLHPNLGIFRRFDSEIVIADIPGIIEGAAEGIGLGNQFLRHISRTNILLFLIEPVLEDPKTTIETFKKLKYEIQKYNPDLLNEKKIIVALNKIDCLNEDDKQAIANEFKPHNLLQISCFLRKGIEKLEQRISEIINETNHN